MSRGLLSQAMLPSSDMITGCIVSSLLPAAEGFAPTIGPVTMDHCRAYWHGFQRLGLAAAPLHCGGWSPGASDLERFRAVVAGSPMVQESHVRLAPGEGTATLLQPSARHGAAPGNE